MKRLGFTVIKNATANIVRGCATAVVALALPHFLTRALDHDRFAAWALMLQLAAYTSYLDFGLQTAVARYLAQAIERKDEEQRDRLVSTAFVLLTMAGVLAVGIVGALIVTLPHLFRQVPVSLVGELRAGLLVMAVSAAMMLPLSTFTGVLIGMHRNEFPALAIGGGRILGAAAVLIAIHFSQSLFLLATCLGVFNLLGGLLQWRIAKSLIPRMRVQIKDANKSMALELIRYCLGLTAFSASMFLVSGLDVTIVGYFSFSAVGYYAIAATFITFVSGFSNSIFGAMMTPVAVLQARGELDRIRDLVLRTTQLSSYAGLMLALSAFIYGFAALKLWVGPIYAQQALPILEILLIAQAIRLTANSYCTMLIATGQQNYGIAVAFVEGFSNLIFSIVGIVWLGPIGVAWGTLIGALIAVICMFPFTMRWAKAVPIPRWLFFRNGILLPASATIPILLFLTFIHTQNSSPRALGMLIPSVIVSVALAIILDKLPVFLRGRPASRAAR